MKMDYEKSVELALANGYLPVPDESAFNGVLYIKNEKKWIHNLNSLKAKLCCTCNFELAELGYDVDAYNKYQNYTNEMAGAEMKYLYVALSNKEGEPIYLMDGMYLFPDGSISEQ